VSEQDPSQPPTCYRHPDRPALLRCSRCERPICADDTIEAPVGYQCPECAAGGQRVRHVRELLPDFLVTKGLVGVIAVIFVATMALPELSGRFGLRPFLLVPSGVALLEAAAPWYTAPELARVIGEPWLLVTSGFLHANLMHVGFNAFLLWMLGQMLEPVLGHARFAALYAAGLAGGGLGVVLLSWLWTTPLADVPVLGGVLTSNPGIPTIGASGAVFALMGAAVVGLRNRGINPWRTDIGTLVLLNLAITFFLPGISVGGHVGGLLAGLAVGKLVFVEHERSRRATVLAVGAAVVMVAVAIALSAGIVEAVLRP
jgi:membrane associated rhomboid family serine protease